MAVALVMATGLQAKVDLAATSGEIRSAVKNAGEVAFNRALGSAAAKAVPGLNPLEARAVAAVTQALVYNLNNPRVAPGQAATIAARVALADLVQQQLEKYVCSNKVGNGVIATFLVGSVEKALSDAFEESGKKGTARVEEMINNSANLVLVVAAAAVVDLAYRFKNGTLPVVGKKQVKPAASAAPAPKSK